MRQAETGAGFVRRAVLALLVLFAAPPAHAGETLVFAAASLKSALDEIAARWSRETGDRATISFAGSSALARQIEAGAPADIFFSASIAWMDYLAERELIRPESRVDLLGNRLVLIAHGAGAPPLEIRPGLDLATRLNGGRLAVALVDAVPAGIYAKAALRSLGIWESVAPHIAQTDNVRSALALVVSGEAPLGVVYRTDAIAESRVSAIGTFPADSHPPIVYPAARLARSDNPSGDAFLRYLQSDAAGVIFERHGFLVVD